MGSLIAALASYLDARQRGGSWLLRMDNLDPPREEPGADQRILQSLQRHGLHWDEDILWQGRRSNAYSAALAKLKHGGQLFHCDCTRARLGAGGACNNRCQPRQQQVTQPFACRVAVPAQYRTDFEDRLQGLQQSPLGQLFPDFVVRRKDGLTAYQLAVVVDDAFQGITHIVRGSDLLDSTPRQIYLQQLLGYSSPTYCHLPVITDATGQKLSKQNHAPALDDSQPGSNLRYALHFLQQAQPPPTIFEVKPLLDFAIHHWKPQAVPRVPALPAASYSP